MDYRVATEELRETSIWFQEDVDWPAKTLPSSMIVPTKFGRPPPWQRAPTEDPRPPFYYIRKVVTTSFPALCWLLRDQDTAADIEAAWLDMPIVKPGRVNRGVNSGTSNKRTRDA